MNLFPFFKTKKINFSEKEWLYDIVKNGQKIERWVAKRMSNNLQHRNIISGLKTINYETAYVLHNKKAFNTLFFQKNYDVVLTSRSGVMIYLKENVEPDYISSHYREGYFVAYLPVGSISFLGLEKNDQLEFIRPNRPEIFAMV